MRVRWLAALTCLLGVLALGVTACGSDDDEGDSGSSSTVSGDTLTIYSSLPLQGTSKGQSEAVISGERLALEQAGGKVGKYKINYVSLDDSTAQNPGTADEAQTAQNARKAVQDKTTIFYLGEFNSGGTKVSLPILNKANIPQISPSNTAVGLTTDEPGADTKAGEPGIYYPAQKRTYARVVPKDTIQGAALATIMKEDGCKSVHIFNDKTTYGAGLARNVESAAKAIGLTVEGNDGTDKTSANYRSLADQIKADCFVGSGVTGENYVQVFKDVAAACPDCKLYGPDGVAEAAFTDPKEGGIPANVAARTKVTVATLSPEEFEKQGIAEGIAVLQGLRRQVRHQAAGSLRDLRLRDDEPRPRQPEGRRRQGQRQGSGAQAAPGEHQGPRQRSRHVRHRRERRHHPDRLRAVHDRQRPADLRQGHQGPGVVAIPS